MKLKSLLATSLALTMSVSLFAGCGNSSNSTNAPSATTPNAPAAGSSAASTPSNSAEPEYVIKFSHNGAGQGAQFDGQTFFKERLEELSGGRIRVDLYPGASLADKAGSMEGLQLGTIEATEVSLIDMSAYDDLWDVFALPYLFDSAEQACEISHDSQVYDILGSNAEENGFVLLSIVSVGSRDIYSKKPINSVEDMKGLKIRVMGSNGLVSAMTDMGASPLSLNWSECYSAMQQGTIDAVENSTEVLYSNGYTELPGFYSFTLHFTIPDLLLFSKVVYDSMPTDLQEAVKQAGIDTEKQWNEVIYKAATDEALETMKNKGVNFINPDLTGFRASAEKTSKNISSNFNEKQVEVYNAINTVKGKYK